MGVAFTDQYVAGDILDGKLVDEDAVEIPWPVGEDELRELGAIFLA